MCYCQRALAYAELLAREAEAHAQKYAAEAAARDVAAGRHPFPASVHEADGRKNGERDGYQWLRNAMREVITFSEFPVRVCNGKHAVRNATEDEVAAISGR